MGAVVGDDDSEGTVVLDDIEEEAFVIKHGYIEDLYDQTNDAVVKAIGIAVLAIDAVVVLNRKGL